MRKFWVYPPVTVSIETLTDCVSNCIMCPHARIVQTRRRSIMPTEQVYQILNQIDWPCEIQWAWINEPLMDSRLPGFVKATKEKGLFSIINTNGYLLDEDLATVLFQNGLSMLNFSIDSVVKETYERIRRGLILDVVLQNYKHALQIRNKLKTKTKIWVSRVYLHGINDSQKETKAFYRAFKDADHVQTNAYRKRGATTDQNLNLGSTPARNYCWFLENDMSISVDGDVPLCSCDACLTTPTGNVFETKLLEIWNNPLRHKIAMGIRRYGMDWYKNCLETSMPQTIWEKIGHKIMNKLGLSKEPRYFKEGQV